MEDVEAFKTLVHRKSFLNHVEGEGQLCMLTCTNA